MTQEIVREHTVEIETAGRHKQRAAELIEAYELRCTLQHVRGLMRGAIRERNHEKLARLLEREETITAALFQLKVDPIQTESAGSGAAPAGVSP